MSCSKFAFQSVREVHLEITDRCNAACPMCPRYTETGQENPNLLGTEISLEDAKRIFPGNILRQLNRIYLCGNFGDPVVANDTLSILKYFRSENPNITLGVHTNGSARSPEWWRELGGILNKPNDYCKFAIDGMDDTNSIYRRRTSWFKIMSSAESFISAGGNAHWEFLVFRHNEHQVERARALAARMGFSRFFVKSTARIVDEKTGENTVFPVHDSQGKVVYNLESPTNPAYQAPARELRNPRHREAMERTSKLYEAEDRFNQILAKYEEFRQKQGVANEKSTASEDSDTVWQSALTSNEANSDETHSSRESGPDIQCMALLEKSIYISAGGFAFPCCFLASQLQSASGAYEGEHVARLIRVHGGGMDMINAKLHPLEKIVEGPWFAAVSASWEKPEGQGLIGTCLRQCGHAKPLSVAEYLE